MRVLVLGHKGMLGHMVVKYLKDNNINVITIDKKYPLSSQQIKQFKGDYIINCIGAIPQKTNDFEINVQIPIWLDINTSCKIIHPGTDCEMDNDEYGKSKKMSAEWIKKEGKKQKKPSETPYYKKVRAGRIKAKVNNQDSSTGAFGELFYSLSGRLKNIDGKTRPIQSG